MDLILTVVADPADSNMINHTKAFSKQGGTLGRSETNNWVLPDPTRVVSSQHCRIEFAQNAYQLFDLSTNGLFINDSDAPLGADKSHPLKDGDILTLGDYKLRASLRKPKDEQANLPKGLGSVDFLDASDRTSFSASMAPQIEAQRNASQFDSWLDGAPKSASATENSEQWGFNAEPSSAAKVAPDQASDPLDFFAKPASTSNDPLAQFESSPISQSAPKWEDDWWKDGTTNDHAAPLSHNMPTPKVASPAPPQEPQSPEPAVFEAVPPPVVTQPSAAPANPFAASAELLRGEPAPQQAPEPAPLLKKPLPETQAPVRVQTQSTPPASGIDGAPDFIAELGLSELAPPQQKQAVKDSIKIVKETISRLIDLLRARTSIKNELRVQRTMIQSVDNNPLKFSATANDAIRTMFSGQGTAFMTPAEAVKDSFDDLSDHQVAVLAGMRAAYKAMFKHFSPKAMEARFGQSGSLLSSKQTKNWIAYCEYYKSLTQDGERTYDDLFGDEFAAAYEKQLTDLKNARAMANRSRNQ